MWACSTRVIGVTCASRPPKLVALESGNAASIVAGSVGRGMALRARAPGCDAVGAAMPTDKLSVTMARVHCTA